MGICKVCNGTKEDRTKPRISDGGHGFYPDCEACKHTGNKDVTSQVLIRVTKPGRRTDWIERLALIYEIAGGLQPENINWNQEPNLVARAICVYYINCGLPIERLLAACIQYERDRGNE